MKRFALIGNPNCGKTTLFNTLTGSKAHVGNWPGVTVEKRSGICNIGSESVEIVDLPGIYSFSPYTDEEVISRNYILNEHPDLVINIIDTTNLERNLYLTSQLLEMDIPVIIALNMMDVLQKNGDTINYRMISSTLNVDVCLISAQKENGMKELINLAIEKSMQKRIGTTFLKESEIYSLVLSIKRELEKNQVENPLFQSVKIIENDELMVGNNKVTDNLISNFKKSFKDENCLDDLEAVIADQRYKYITKNLSIYYKRNNNIKETKSEKIDRILTNKWLGLPIFLMILFLMFHFTFSENLFYLGGLFKNVEPSFKGSIYEGLIYTSSGINSIGVILFNFFDMTFSYVTDLVSNIFPSSSWVQSFVCDGVLGGIFAVLSFVPQILLLFLFFSILEDSGYMARIAYILDRIFKKFGLSGRSFLPMIMGFGCSVPAMINTRTLNNDNEKTATIRVIPFFSCGAKLPILVGVAGGICQVFGFNHVDLITNLMYLIGILTAIVTLILMRNTIMKNDISPFIMELPNYHLPKFKSLMIHMYDKLKHYIEKAFTIILASTIIIWFLQSFTWKLKYIDNVNSNEIIEEHFNSSLEDENIRNNIIKLNDKYENTDISLELLISDYNNLNEDEKKKYDNVLAPIINEGIEEYKNIISDSAYVDAKDSILASIGKVIQPIFTPLGFGSQLNDNGWVYGVSALTGLIAKENVIATFSVLAECTTDYNDFDYSEFILDYTMSLDDDGTYAATKMIKNSGLNKKKGYAALISFIVFNMTTIPCFAAVATAKAELTKKKFFNTLLFWISTSFIVSSIVYLVLSWWYFIFVVLGLAILTIIGIGGYNKYENNRNNCCD